MSSDEEVYNQQPAHAHHHDNHNQDLENGSEAGPSRKRMRQEHVPQPVQILPSIFGIPPRNEFTKTIGEFIMHNARGKDNIEIEIKLGTLNSITPLGQMPKRIALPALSETIIPSDYQIGGFVSDMTVTQHHTLNNLLNDQVNTLRKIGHPQQMRHTRIRHIDSFYPHPGSTKIRVSTDLKGKVVEGGSIKKRRVADLNIFSPHHDFDWRVSISTEEPYPMPNAKPEFSREKDRVCYTHQVCQVDLTAVKNNQDVKGKPLWTYELEIELLDVSALIVEGEKEERGEPNQFDEILQSCLDTVRMLIRNV